MTSKAVAKAFPSVFVSVVVARNGNKFCCTDESRGWYLPAGRVDFGETFTTAAVRESMEEAGLDVRLDGILRFEYSTRSSVTRFRCIFAGSPRNPLKPLKKIADEETYGAAWFTHAQLLALSQDDSAMIAHIHSLPHRVAQQQSGHLKKLPKEKLRGRGPLKLFEWAGLGTKVFGLDLYEGQDGEEIDSKRVNVKMQYTVALVVHSVPSNTFLLVKGKGSKNKKMELPKENMTEIEDFELPANRLCRLAELLMSHKTEQVQVTRGAGGSKGFSLKSLMKALPFGSSNKLGTKPSDNVSPKDVELKGLCGFHHTPPRTATSEGKLCITYYAETTAINQANNAESGKIIWRTASEVVSDEHLSENEKKAVENCASNTIAPLGFLAPEGSRYHVLS